MNQKIIPLRETCDCGNKVTSHHYLCSSCWGNRAKRDVEVQRRLINIEGIIANRVKLGQRIPQNLMSELNSLKNEWKNICLIKDRNRK